MNSVIITCNAGSTNTKLAVFDSGILKPTSHAVTHNAKETSTWLSSMNELAVVAFGHRVVHGGRDFIHPEVITNDVLEKLKSYIPMAPLHQPAALGLIEEAQKLYPDVPHIACFDTAFHHTMPDVERRLPLPRRFHDEGIMRYGFHGLSYQHIAAVLPEFAGDKANSRVIVAHLGGGSSACAMKNQQSIASTMGFSTLDGLMMGTRCGALDSGVLLYLLMEKELSAAEVSDLLYYQSGLRGVSDISGDMQELLENKSPPAQEAIGLYCALAAKQIFGLLPSLGGLDALVFTGGIGEHATVIRETITRLLRWIGDFPVYVIPTDEELVMAQACYIKLKG